ncbi:hypothetical protein BH23ACI1_BH23ACI1_27220 [soil metagenome]
MRGVVVLAACALWPAAAAGQPFELSVDAPPELQRMAARVQAMDPAPMEGALARAGLDLPPRVHVTLLPDSDARVRSAPAWVVARAFGTDTIIIFPERISSYPYDSLEAVMLHEIVHLALVARAGGQPLPRWFHEGVAVSVEAGWGLGSQARLLLAAARGPAIDDVSRLFRSESHPDTTTAYLLAAALIEDVRARHGQHVPGAIAGHVARGTSFDRAFWIETGDTVDRAAGRAWSAYRGWSRWMPVVTSPAALWSWILALAFVAFVLKVRRRRERRRQWDEDDDQEDEAALEEESEIDESPPRNHR